MSGTIPLQSSLNHPTLLFPELQSESLLSIGQLCDEGNVAVFDKKHLKVYKENKITQQLLNTIPAQDLIP